MIEKELNIEVLRVPQSVAIIRDWFLPEELDLIWSELDVICSPFVLQKPEQTGAARTDDGAGFLKKGHGLFIDHFYENKREVSHILNIGRRVFSPQIVEALTKEDPHFQHIGKCDSDFTLVNYYEQGDEYKMHTDMCVYTANIVLWREPKKFDGGKFIIQSGEKEIDFDLRSNDMIIFPGFTRHAVTPMTMHGDATPWRSGRYSIANFISYK